MVDRVDAVVIGAGVVGLACARALALAGREVLILERTAQFGTETSARNSEVIHAGIHYPSGSLKARLCVLGKVLLYRFCDEHAVPYRNCGKLIVSTTVGQDEKLLQIKQQAAANGVNDLRLLSAAEVAELEPALRCRNGLHSPSTGIIDSHAFMLALLADLEQLGGTFAPHTEFDSALARSDGIELKIRGANEYRIIANAVVNCAGHQGPSIAARIKGMPIDLIPRPFLAKGNYFELIHRAPFTRLIYPIPVPGGLGIHLTLDLGGKARFGPDVQWIETMDYDVDARRAQAFCDAIQTYWPDIRVDMLAPSYAGIRPKIAGPGAPDADFLVQGPESHGVSGLLNLFGIESPGLTASLALGDLVASKLGRT
jgi:L-2-hydroxyglutarate oxidase LhgO